MGGIYNTLPYDIDYMLMVWLVQYSTIRLNGEISTINKDGLTARERLYARKNDKHWVKHGFSDYVQVHDRYTSN